jgi:type IV pilus assembly protein PilC
MDFEYTVLDKDKKLIKGRSSAESASLLVGQLKKKGLIPQKIRQIKSESTGRETKKSFFSKDRVNPRELAVITRQLSSCLNAGLLITEALDTIKDDLENFYLRRILNDIVATINSGSIFSNALVKYPDVFSETFVAMIKAGEETGRLDKTLEVLSKYLEDTEKTKEKIKSALRYPLFVLGFFFMVVFVIVFFIIPKFKAMFLTAGAKLPLITAIVVGTNEFIFKNFFWLAGVLLIIGICGWFLARIPRVSLFFDYAKFRVPVFGKILKKVMILRLCWTLSILISGGVSVITALKISAGVNTNAYLKNIMTRVRFNIMAGHTFSSEIKNEAFFPSLIVKMVQVGEKSGKIADMLKRSADYYTEEVERSIQDMTVLIEPMLIVLIGGVVLITVLALYLPIFNISTAVR